MKSFFYILAGHIFLFLGIIGAFLPILPTTPFLLLTAFCYSKGNSKFHAWLINHKYFGPPIGNWQKHGVIGIKAKILASFFLSLVMILKIPYLSFSIPLRIFIEIVMLGVLIFIWTRPSIPQKETEKKNGGG